MHREQLLEHTNGPLCYCRSIRTSGATPSWSGTSIDPDFVPRMRLSEAERLQYLSDIAGELEFASELRPTTVLDFGAGPGWFLLAIDAPVKDAVEIDPVCRDILRDAGVWVAQSLDTVPDDRYDLVICHHVIEHCDDPWAIMAGLRDKVRSCAHLIFATPDFDSVCAQRFGDNYRMLHDRTHVSLFTRVSAERFLRGFGFDVIAISTPFPNRYSTIENLKRWNDTSKVSPPWPGNWVTFYCKREC